MTSQRPWPIVFCLAAFFVQPVAADEAIDKLIDDLVRVSEPGCGYSAYFAGSEFLPYDDTEHLGTMVLGATQRARSESLRKLVERGADAVPALLKHLGDERPIAMKPVSGMMWMSYDDEYDFNQRTQAEPTGVNRDGFRDGGGEPDGHSVTVGDLCYVALGQIVNRNFVASRYQPSGGVIVNSPTYSKRLHDAVLKDWGALTPAEHRRRLVEDFEQADSPGRQLGAYLRLSLYYPDEVERLVLAELKRPTFDPAVVHTFCRERLYQAADVPARLTLYEKFLREHGAHYAAGVEAQLFEDLDTLEAHESGRLSPPLKEYVKQPRELLILLFRKPADVKSADRPLLVVPDDNARVELIGGLTHDSSRNIAEAVRQILQEHESDDYFAAACARCLANRGYGEQLVALLDRIDLHEQDWRKMRWQLLKAIATSRDPAVQQRLLHVLKTTTNEHFFVLAAAGLQAVDGATLFAQATRVIKTLPDGDNGGQQLLSLIAERFPGLAVEVFRSFLADGTTQRAMIACRVLWYGHPKSKEILGPLLEDRRNVSQEEAEGRVCDYAAQALSHAVGGVEFDLKWSTDKKDEAVRKLKAVAAKPGA